MRNFVASLLSKARYNFWMKLLSLGLAFLVWLVVIAYYNPETTNMLRDIPIVIDQSGEILEEQGLTLVTDVDKTVDAKIEGRREKMAVINKDKVVATVNVSSVTKPGEYDLPVIITMGTQQLNTVSQSIDTITLKFEKNTKASFTIEAVAKGKVEKNHILEKSVTPNVVTVSGPESVINQIATVQAVVEQDKFAESGVFDATLHYLDKNGEEVPSNFLTTDIENIKVNISVYEEKNVPLQLDVVNSAGGNDAAFLDIKIEPASINIAGTAEALAGINSISLGKLDASQITADSTQSIPLIVPNGIKNIDSVENASVKVTLSGTVTRHFTIPTSAVKIENLPAGIKAEPVGGNIVLTVRGLSKDLEKLTADHIVLTADCKNLSLSKGSNIVSLCAVFPDKLNVGAVGKYELNIKVS